MSIQVMSNVWDCPAKTHTQQLVLLALADNSNDQGFCWPSVSLLARKCVLSKQGVLDQIDSLEKDGRVSVVRKNGLVNHYRLAPVPRRDQSHAGTSPKATPPPVNHVDQSTTLTGQPGLPPPVNGVDYHQSTGLTGPVNRVDPNHQEPSVEPSVEPSLFPGVAGCSAAKTFREGWCAGFKERFGVEYLFQGGKDGSAIKRLLAAKIDPADLLALAREAWDYPAGFNCKLAVSVAGFAARFNEIRAELQQRPAEPKNNRLKPGQMTEDEIEARKWDPRNNPKY